MAWEFDPFDTGAMARLGVENVCPSGCFRYNNETVLLAVFEQPLPNVFRVSHTKVTECSFELQGFHVWNEPQAGIPRILDATGTPIATILENPFWYDPDLPCF